MNEIWLIPSTYDNYMFDKSSTIFTVSNSKCNSVCALSCVSVGLPGPVHGVRAIAKIPYETNRISSYYNFLHFFKEFGIKISPNPRLIREYPFTTTFVLYSANYRILNMHKRGINVKMNNIVPCCN